MAACGGPTFESVCERAGDECGLADDEVAECKQYAALAEDAAEQAGCESELDDYIGCIDGQENFCTSTFGAACGSELQTLDQCASVGQSDPPG